jgi:hypothetical protein
MGPPAIHRIADIVGAVLAKPLGIPMTPDERDWLILYGLCAVWGLAYLCGIWRLTRRKVDRREIQAELDAELDAVNRRTWLENGGKPRIV